MSDKRKQPKRSGMARQAALSAVPHTLPPVRVKEQDGKLYVTVRFQRPGWQRLLGADSTCERTFGLDAYGRSVYESCDGRRTVTAVIARFAEANRVSIPEAELAVTQFMRTLVSKGLVVLEVERKERGS